jgi:hypothetical protein
VVRYWKSPKLYDCTLADIVADVTTAFVGTTTPAKIEVGTATSANAYGTMYFGSAATPSPVSVALRMQDKLNGSAAVANHTIPANSQVKITYTQGTGGTPAGVADVAVVFAVAG